MTALIHSGPPPIHHRHQNAIRTDYWVYVGLYVNLYDNLVRATARFHTRSRVIAITRFYSRRFAKVYLAIAAQLPTPCRMRLSASSRTRMESCDKTPQS